MDNLTIVIPCKDDPMIVDCIKSIPEQFLVTVVFNGCADGFSERIKKDVIHPEVEWHELSEANLSRALEYGAREARSDWILFMDADCVFSPGAIEAVQTSMRQGSPQIEVFKGNVVFDHSDSLSSKLIAKSRQHHTAEVLTAYKPPLAMDRRIAQKVGGYLFDWRLKWREDADLDHRIRAAGIEIVGVSDCEIYHEALNLRDDLRSTFRYGVGEAMADILGKKLTDVPRSVWSTLRSQGIGPALYMLFRNRIYTAGYVWASISLKNEYRMKRGHDPKTL